MSHNQETARVAAQAAWKRKSDEATAVALGEALYNSTNLSEQEESVLFNMLFSRLLELDDFSCWSVRKIIERNTKK